MLLFLFFKQKTAYELRISDWSSDVCSSDLEGEQEEAAAPADDAGGREGREVELGHAARDRDHLVGEGREPRHQHDPQAPVVVERPELGELEIGIESCKSRVVQYV